MTTCSPIPSHTLQPACNKALHAAPAHAGRRPTGPPATACQPLPCPLPPAQRPPHKRAHRCRCAPRWLRSRRGRSRRWQGWCCARGSGAACRPPCTAQSRRGRSRPGAGTKEKQEEGCVARRGRSAGEGRERVSEVWLSWLHVRHWPAPARCARCSCSCRHRFGVAAAVLTAFRRRRTTASAATQPFLLNHPAGGHAAPPAAAAAAVKPASGWPCCCCCCQASKQLATQPLLLNQQVGGQAAAAAAAAHLVHDEIQGKVLDEKLEGAMQVVLSGRLKRRAGCRGACDAVATASVLLPPAPAWAARNRPLLPLFPLAPPRTLQSCFMAAPYRVCSMAWPVRSAAAQHRYACPPRP